MPVALRDSTQFTVQSSSSATLALPPGTAAGDVLICWCEDGRYNRPADTSGWYASAHRFGACWWRVVTAADVTAGSVALLGEVTGLVSVTGCRGIGVRRDGKGVTVSETGAAVIVTAFRPPPASTVDPSGNRLDSVVEHEDWPHSWWLLTGGTAGSFLGLSGTNGDASYYAWELLPKVGPNPPTLSTPLAGAEVEAGINHTLTWVHNSTSGATQTGYRIRYREVGVTAYWLYVDAYGFGDVVEHNITSSVSSATVDSSVFTTGKNWEWAVATQDEGTWSSYSASQSFWSRPAPTVDSVTVAAPAEDLTPVVSATWTMGYGTVAWWRVWVTLSTAATYDDAPLYDSGVMAYAGSADHVVAATDADGALRWTNGGTYKAWVQVGQQGGLYSDPTGDDVSFTVSWTPPAAPGSVTVIDGTPPRVLIETVPTGCGIEVQWTENPGAGWVHLSSVALADADEEVAAPLAPYGVGVWARARSVETIDGQPIASAWTTSAATVTTDAGAYLVSDDGADWLAVRLSGDDDRRPMQGVSVTVGHGATTARVQSTAAAGWMGTVTLSTRSDSERAEVVEWLTTRPAWWLRWPPERSAFGAMARVDRGATRMAEMVTPGESRIGDGPLSDRRITFGWVEQ